MRPRPPYLAILWCIAMLSWAFICLSGSVARQRHARATASLLIFPFADPQVPPATFPTMNVDNFLGDKPSTRVRAPPGGASSFSLAWDAPAPAPARAAPARAEPAPVAAASSYDRPSARPAPAAAAVSGALPSRNACELLASE